MANNPLSSFSSAYKRQIINESQSATIVESSDVESLISKWIAYKVAGTHGRGETIAEAPTWAELQKKIASAGYVRRSNNTWVAAEKAKLSYGFADIGFDIEFKPGSEMPQTGHDDVVNIHEYESYKGLGPESGKIIYTGKLDQWKNGDVVWIENKTASKAPADKGALAYPYGGYWLDKETVIGLVQAGKSERDATTRFVPLLKK